MPANKKLAVSGLLRINHWKEKKKNSCKCSKLTVLPFPSAGTLLTHPQAELAHVRSQLREFKRILTEAFETLL